jgi:hypothetical protein
MASLMPPGKQQYLTSTGIPLVGGKVYTYSAGTTTPLATYTDAGGLTPNANPVVLDSRGEASIFFAAPNSYKVVLKDSTDATIWTQDNLVAVAQADSNLIVYTPAGTGAVETTVQTKLREKVSAKDFGAVCDGVTDDTTKILLAANSGAKVVEIPKNCLFDRTALLATLPSTVVCLDSMTSLLVVRLPNMSVLLPQTLPHLIHIGL